MTCPQSMATPPDVISDPIVLENLDIPTDKCICPSNVTIPLTCPPTASHSTSSSSTSSSSSSSSSSFTSSSTSSLSSSSSSESSATSSDEELENNLSDSTTDHDDNYEKYVTLKRAIDILRKRCKTYLNQNQLIVRRIHLVKRFSKRCDRHIGLIKTSLDSHSDGWRSTTESHPSDNINLKNCLRHKRIDVLEYKCKKLEEFKHKVYTVVPQTEFERKSIRMKKHKNEKLNKMRYEKLKKILERVNACKPKSTEPSPVAKALLLTLTRELKNLEALQTPIIPPSKQSTIPTSTPSSSPSLPPLPLPPSLPPPLAHLSKTPRKKSSTIMQSPSPLISLLPFNFHTLKVQHKQKMMKNLRRNIIGGYATANPNNEQRNGLKIKKTKVKNKPNLLELQAIATAKAVKSLQLKSSIDLPPPMTNIVLQSKAVALKRKRAKEEKDPNAPKRPINAFFLYCQENRIPLTKEFNALRKPNEPELTKQDLTRQLALRWRTLNDEGKQAYINKYEESKLKYNNEMKSYKKK